MTRHKKTSIPPTYFIGLCFSLNMASPAIRMIITLNIKIVLMVPGLVPDLRACFIAKIINTFPIELVHPLKSAQMKILNELFPENQKFVKLNLIVPPIK
jgi:hypothetical protein